jgi:hypothetical protein
MDITRSVQPAEFWHIRLIGRVAVRLTTPVPRRLPAETFRYRAVLDRADPASGKTFESPRKRAIVSLRSPY